MIQAEALIDKFKYALESRWGYIMGTAGIMWTQAKQNQKINYMVSNYGTSWQKNGEAKNSKYYNSALKGSKWIGHMVADCSGLFVWAYKELGSKDIYHGSNSIYNKCCKAKGVLTEGKKEDKQPLLPGTAVFTGTDKDRGHIGLYIGNGKVIEASGVDAGVCTSNVTAGKWKWWGELKLVNYGGEAEPEPDPGDQLPTLRRESKGPYVTKMQTELKQRGYDLGPYGIDGDYGKATEAAVRQFQKDWGLTQDGICGPQTWKMLTTAPVKETTYTVTIPGLTRAEAQELCKKYKGSGMKEE